jgi:hypothetical protein
MMQINLSNLHLFDNKQIALLNRFAKINKSLMPHAIAVAIGCRLEEAMALLLFLYGKSVVNGYLLIYHNQHPDFYFEKRELKEGLPAKDYYCPVCESNLLSNKDIYFDFEFTQISDFTFVGE